MDEKKIKSNLKELRIAKGLSQLRLANEMNIGRNTYINIENGDTHMLNPHLYDAAGILGCSLERLLQSALDEEEHGGVLYDKTSEIEEELVNLRDENERLRDENGKLKEKITQLEEMLSLQKEVAGFSKEKVEQLEKELKKKKDKKAQ